MTPTIKPDDTNSPQVLESVPNCPVCGHGESRFLFRNTDRLFRIPGTFPVVECAGCGLVRLSERPTESDVKRYYPDNEYYIYQAPQVSFEKRPGLAGTVSEVIRESVLATLGYPAELNFLQKAAQPIFARLFMDRATRGWLQKLPRYVHGGSALDIGCGNGHFLGLLKHLGWKVRGVEMNAQAAGLAREHFDIDVFEGMLEDAPLDDESFDYINISHVLEHIYDPTAFLQRVRRLLKPTGTVYIEVPNFASFAQETSREFWYGWETPRHVSMFTPASLRLMVEKAGLRIKNMETQVGDSWAWDLTYRIEEERGSELETRPSDSPEVAAECERLRREAARRFRSDRMCGDIINCWAERG
jgi:2-polyprenyl-3-methyl-5-hydroxy-6-metoxy-1,4-benzoquinol methylase